MQGSYIHHNSSSSSSCFPVGVSYMEFASLASWCFSSISHGLLHLPPSASFLSDPLTNSHSILFFVVHGFSSLSLSCHKLSWCNCHLSLHAQTIVIIIVAPPLEAKVKFPSDIATWEQDKSQSKLGSRKNKWLSWIMTLSGWLLFSRCQHENLGFCNCSLCH